MNNRRFSFELIILSFMVGVLLLCTSVRADVVENGKKVKIEYTLKIDGIVIESSEGKEPLEYVQGEDQIISGLSAGIEGMEVDEQKNIIVSPTEGYGEVNTQAFREIEKDKIPADQELVQGQVIQLSTPDGETIPGIVWEIREDTIVVNFNHPLAGKTLDFDVKVVSVE